jgi:hypothetical protein
MTGKSNVDTSQGEAAEENPEDSHVSTLLVTVACLAAIDGLVGEVTLQVRDEFLVRVEDCTSGSSKLIVYGGEQFTGLTLTFRGVHDS